MEIVSSIKNIPNYPKAYVTMGTFDGFHIGHQEIIRRLLASAKRDNVKSILITYVPHPREVVQDMKRNPIQFVTTMQERLKLLSETGIDYIIIHPFTKDLLKMEPEVFVRDTILKNINVQGFVIGYSHSFGKDRKGTPEFLKKLGEEKYNFPVEIVKEVNNKDFTVNSTNIRRLIAAGDIEEANKYLGRPFQIKGTIVSGDNRGSKLGYPTLNILPLSPKKMIPHIGVYCVRVYFKRKTYLGMCNIGYRPTFDGKYMTIEVHLIDTTVRARSGNEIDVKFFKKIRDEIRFDSAEQLIEQLNKDKKYCKDHLQLEDL